MEEGRLCFDRNGKEELADLTLGPFDYDSIVFPQTVGYFSYVLLKPLGMKRRE